MLSIRFNANREWWVSSTIFDRLFQSALDGGKMPPDLEHWRHVADANGGLDLSAMVPSEADELIKALRYTAERDLVQLAAADLSAEDASYCTGILKLLEVTS